MIKKSGDVIYSQIKIRKINNRIKNKSKFKILVFNTQIEIIVYISMCIHTCEMICVLENYLQYNKMSKGTKDWPITMIKTVIF